MDVSAAEARGVLVAVHLCKTLCFNRIHLVGDAQAVINAVNSSLLDWSRVGISVEDIKFEL
jgi:ribonuclease HI